MFEREKLGLFRHSKNLKNKRTLSLSEKRHVRQNEDENRKKIFFSWRCFYLFVAS